jgi:hypothetical protein
MHRPISRSQSLSETLKLAREHLRAIQSANAALRHTISVSNKTIRDGYAALDKAKARLRSYDREKDSDQSPGA